MMLRFRFLSASLDRCSKNIRVSPIVIAELELGNIERHIFPAHFVECADHATLEDRPKAFNRVGMDSADNIMTRGVMDGFMVEAGQSIINSALVSRKQAHFMVVSQFDFKLRHYPLYGTRLL